MNHIEKRKHDKQALVDQLEKAGATFRGNNCRCPFHDDHRPSAGIFNSESGWRFKCRNFDTTREIKSKKRYFCGTRQGFGLSKLKT